MTDAALLDAEFELGALEAEYRYQPVHAQASDLVRINQLRAALNLPAAAHDDLTPKTGRRAQAAPQAPPRKQDHAKARMVFAAYLEREERLAPHRAHADLVCRETAGNGQTPVRPIATRGPRGGGLVCDFCGKPILLEGGQFHGRPAADAWKRATDEQRQGAWKSWILGGVVVEIVENGTLRVYHGHTYGAAHECATKGLLLRRAAEAAFVRPEPPCTIDDLIAYLEDERPDVPPAGRTAEACAAYNAAVQWDPGIGKNRPA